MGLGIIGKIMQDNEKQHTYSAGEDKNADENPGYTQWRHDNKKMDDNQQTLNQFKKFKENKKSNALESDSMLNMNSPLHNAYTNPKFVDESGAGKAFNEGAKALLDTAVKHFKDPARKARHQEKRAERIDKRVIKRDSRFAKTEEVKQTRALVADIESNPKNIKGREEIRKSFNESVRKPFYDKSDKLSERSKDLTLKSDANEMIADEIAKYAGMTKNQIYNQKERERENENKNKNNNNNNNSMFSNYKVPGLLKSESTLERFMRTGKTSQQQ